MSSLPETTSSASGRHRGRHHAREAAVQMLYQWEVGHADIDEVLRTFWLVDLPGAQGASEQVRMFAEDLVRGTVGNVERIDGLITSTAEHWRLSRMASLDRLILRMAI